MTVEDSSLPVRNGAGANGTNHTNGATKPLNRADEVDDVSLHKLRAKQIV
jgi:hypothetical protein